jgi:ribonuclease HII
MTMKKQRADSAGKDGLAPKPGARRRGVSLGYEVERGWLERGFSCIAGTDEVGRGPLAGPVVAAAVVLRPGFIPEGLNDSKAMTAKRREEVCAAVLAGAYVGVAAVPAGVIDRINIREASLLAMRRAVAALPVKPDLVLADGRDVPAAPCRAEAYIKGDSRVASIAAASIVAKVMRDRMMKNLALFYPEFLFEKNAGYGVAGHLAALEKFGPSPCHRLSFSPISQKSFLF